MIQSAFPRSVRLTCLFLGCFSIGWSLNPGWLVAQEPPAGAASSQYSPLKESEIEEVLRQPLAITDCIRIALATNFSLKVARAELSKAEATQWGAANIFHPTFAIIGNKEKTIEKRPATTDPNERTRLTFRNQSVVGTVTQMLPTGTLFEVAGDLSRDTNAPDKFSVPPTTQRNRQVVATVTQPLLRNAWPNITRSPLRTAAYDRQMQGHQVTDDKLQTIFQVKQAFYDVLLQRDLMRVNQEAIVRDSSLVDASRAKLDAEIATRRDILSAEIQLADDRTKLIKSQSDYQLSLDRLKQVMGVPIDLEIDIADIEMAYSEKPLDDTFLIQRAKDYNPLIERARTSIRRTELQASVARNASLPQLDLSLSYTGNIKTEPDDNDPTLDFEVRNSGWQASFELSYPLLNRDARSKRQIAQLAVSQERDRLAELERQITVDIRNVIRGTRSSVQEIKSLQRSIDAAQEKVDFANTMFNLGRASNLDITDAQEALLKAQTQFIQKLVDYNVQLALLESLTDQVIVP